MRIHAVLASPQQLHQYCIQLRTWQRSSVLHFQRKRATPTTGQLSLLLLEGGLCEGQSTNTFTITLSHSYLNLCCIKRQKRQAKEGHTNWEYFREGSRSWRGTSRKLCCCVPHGRRRTREFDRISVHLLHAQW